MLVVKLDRYAFQKRKTRKSCNEIEISISQQQNRCGICLQLIQRQENLMEQQYLDVFFYNVGDK